jgi:HD superfamily phosphohydrolase
MSWRNPFLDPLYGSIEFDVSLADLVGRPVVQRLRHIRLSNIDSIDIPSIANLSRFEHVIGVAHLAGEAGFRVGLGRFDDLILRGSALLHDWAITSFGHLVEEALQYVGTGFDHEERFREIVSGKSHDEIMGIDLQIIEGRQTGIRDWARKVAGSDSDKLMHGIMDHIRGDGSMGRVIAGDIDLDNIDNLFRMAFHMGVPIDRAAPGRLAKAMIGVTGEPGEPVFQVTAEPDINAWRQVRREVYTNLMLAERDFVGKLMVLSATVQAYEAGELKSSDWSLVDHDFLVRLLRSENRDVRDTAQRWVTGELWDCTPLRWMSGDRPRYSDLLTFSKELGEALSRPCFAYGIKDKRDRKLSTAFADGSRREYGQNARQWLLGIGSSKRMAFRSREIERAFDFARNFFKVDVIGPATKEAQACLF